MAEKLLRVITCKCGRDGLVDMTTPLHEWKCDAPGCKRVGQCTEDYCCPGCMKDIELPEDRYTDFLQKQEAEDPTEEAEHTDKEQ